MSAERDPSMTLSAGIGNCSFIVHWKERFELPPVVSVRVDTLERPLRAMALHTGVRLEMSEELLRPILERFNSLSEAAGYKFAQR